MSLFDTFRIAGSGVSAQAQRLNAVASNLANADSATAPGAKPYQAKQVVFQAEPAAGKAGAEVKVKEVIDDPSPPRRVHDPRHPLADAEGYVAMPNVNVVEEVINMISASRGYQNNIEVMNTAKTLMQKTLTLGQ